MTFVILNADDNDGVRYARSRTLEAAGLQVVEAVNGTAALSLAERHLPSVALIDVYLPDVDGVEVCRRLKRAPKTAMTQVVMISASAIAEPYQAEALNAGADYYLTDPVSPDVLVGTIRAACRHWHALSESRRAKEQLAEANASLQAVFERTASGIAIFDAAGSLMSCNGPFALLHGFQEPREAIRELADCKSVIQAFFPDGKPLATQDWPVMRSVRGEVVSEVEIHGRRKDGTREWVALCSSAPLYDDRNQVRGVVLATYNVTEHKRAQQELERSRNEYHRHHELLTALFEYIPEGITVADAPDVAIRMVSKFGQRLLGRPLESLAGISVDEHAQKWSIYAPDGVTPARNEDLPLTRSTLNGEIVCDEEWVVRSAAGEQLWMLCNSGPIRDASGRVTGGVIAWRDITKRKSIEAALAESEERLRILLECAELGTCVLTPSTGELKLSPAAKWMHGLAADAQFTYELCLSKVHPEDREHVSACLNAALDNGRHCAFEYRVMHTDGSVRWLSLRGRVSRTAGTPPRIYSVLWDITERKQAEQELERSRERVELAQTAALVGFFDYNPATGEVYWSEQMEKMFGLQPGTFHNTYSAWASRVHPEDLPAIEQMIAESFRTGRTRFVYDFRALQPNGTYRWHQGTSLVFFDPDGSPVRMIGTNIDITDRVESQQRLERSNADLQQFAYAASHDLQEPLRMVAAYSELLARKHLGGHPEADDFIRHIQTGIQRIKRLLSDLLAYSTVAEDDAPAAQMAITLEPVLAEALWNLQTAIAEAHAIVTFDELPAVLANERQMVHVLQNLVGNAIKYRKPGSVPTVHLSATRQGRDWIICVEDNGIGFDSKHADHIFGVFKRLHSQQQYPGSGVGLAICKRIIERHHGKIWAESTVGNGSKFYFSLPAANTDEGIATAAK